MQRQMSLMKKITWLALGSSLALLAPNVPAQDDGEIYFDQLLLAQVNQRQRPGAGERDTRPVQPLPTEPAPVPSPPVEISPSTGAVQQPPSPPAATTTADADSLLRRPGSDQQQPVVYPDAEPDQGPPVRVGEARQPGPQDAPYVEPNPLPDPNRKTQLGRTFRVDPLAPTEFSIIDDRWRLPIDLGIRKERWYDPYNFNILKADRPMFDDWFINLAFISDTTIEPRRLPIPVSPQVSRDPGDLDIFGDTDQFVFLQNLTTSLVIIKGDTVFRPPDYEIRVTPVFNYNYVRVDENRALFIDPEDGNVREDNFVGMQELFFDYHIRNVSDRYDFDSFRIGIQPFSTDFRGFLFQDNQFGFRLFGTRDNNFWQYNLAWFRRVEKDTNSGLNNIWTDDLRDDDIYIANLYRQDWPVLGFTSQATIVHNRNKEDNKLFFDENGILVRPASVGEERLRNYEVTYIGYNGDGHFGRLNLTASAYYAFGEESTGTFTAKESDIRGFFAAAEAGLDLDWIRLRFSGVYGSGDDDPFDDRSEGFDAIFENPIIAGFDTNFWTRQNIPLVGGGGVTVSTRNGLLNNLRSSKEQGQSNFTNPGIILLGFGTDLDLTPELRLSTNINKLWFDETAPLEAARNQGPIDDDIGWDVSAALIYRPLFSQNIVVRLSAAALIPGDGYEDLFGDETAYSVLGNIIFAY